MKINTVRIRLQQANGESRLLCKRNSKGWSLHIDKSSHSNSEEEQVADFIATQGTTVSQLENELRKYN